MRHFKLLAKLVLNPSLINPNVTCKSLCDLDFSKLKKEGIEFLIFDKDNTLSETYKMNYYNSQVKDSIKEVLTIYGQNKVGILSNSIEVKDIAPFENEIKFIPATTKKPFNFKDAKNFFGNCENEKIAVIGDRLLTDVFMANLNGALSIHIEPLERSHEKINIKLIRFLEESFLGIFYKKRREHTNFPKKNFEKIEK